uniref:Uncharacterized protein n=1 Tax=Oryctolagus cuniculus TaxID=9986 RepID=A0A5F9D212_RABIT
LASRASTCSSNCEISCFANLTNTYYLMATEGSENFHRRQKKSWLMSTVSSAIREGWCIPRLQLKTGMNSPLFYRLYSWQAL